MNVEPWIQFPKYQQWQQGGYLFQQQFKWNRHKSFCLQLSKNQRHEACTEELTWSWTVSTEGQFLNQGWTSLHCALRWFSLIWRIGVDNCHVFTGTLINLDHIQKIEVVGLKVEIPWFIMPWKSSEGLARRNN